MTVAKLTALLKDLPLGMRVVLASDGIGSSFKLARGAMQRWFNFEKMTTVAPPTKATQKGRPKAGGPIESEAFIIYPDWDLDG